jgi:NitT/TauT family transport system substrate-binding protein
MVTRLSSVVLLAAGLLASAAYAQGTVRLGHNRAWNNPALILGITQGYFQKAGVTVAERSFNNPADIIQAIASGDLDAGAGTSGVLFTAVERGVKAKAVALLQGAQTPPVAFMVRRDSPIKAIADLKGKTVAIGGFGGTSDLLLRYWASRAGLDPKNDMKIIFLPFHLTLPSVVNGQVDAAPVDPLISIKGGQQFGGQTRNLFTYEDVTKQAFGTDNVNAMMLVLGDAFVEKNRDTAVRFMEGYVRAVRAVRSDPKKALAQLAEASKDPAIEKLNAPTTLSQDGKVYADALKFEADMAHRFGYVKQPVNVTQVVDNSLIEEAAARIK